MTRELALIAEGGGARGAYVYGAMAALDEVFNDQHGLANFSYMAGTSASALTMMYAMSGQFHSDGLDIWTKKVALKRFMNSKSLGRLFTAPPILDVEYLVDEIFEKQHPFAWHQFIKTKSKFYIPLVDVNTLSLKFYTNDTDVSSALLPYELIFMDKNNPAEIYSLMKAAAAVPVFFNKEIMIQGKPYVDGAVLSPFPLTAPIPSAAKRICILTKPQAPGVRWLRDRFIPSVARSGFFQGNISNANLYGLASEENKNYQALLDQVDDLESCVVIKPSFEMSSSGNSPAELKRNIKAGFEDVIRKKVEIEALINAE
jgi:predicted patatin/cPLA2 family phospholipase